MKWLYNNNDDNSCRYILGTVGTKPLICVGVNPSTAEPDSLDKTLESVERISKNNGYDSWVMINLYPQRATKPNDMDKACNDMIKIENIDFIKRLLSQYPNSDIWAAWGTLIRKRKYLKDCLALLVEVSTKYNSNWITFGTRSKNGHPHHPLYLKSNSPKEIFDVISYQAAI